MWLLKFALYKTGVFLQSREILIWGYIKFNGLWKKKNKKGEDKVKTKTILFLFICSIWLVACNSNKETTKTIEIQKLINFEEVKPDTLQLISDAKAIKVIEKTFRKARKFGEVDNKIVPQYKIKLNDDEYYLWIDNTITGTIANVNNRNMFYNILATEEFKEAINYQEQK